jgi:hypothetical protein
VTEDPPRAKPARKRRPAGEPPEAVPIPEHLATPEFVATWGRWIADRAARRIPMTAEAARQQLETLAPHPLPIALEAVRRSISRGWRDVFPEPDRPAPVGTLAEDTSARARSLAARLRAAEEAAQHDR